MKDDMDMKTNGCGNRGKSGHKGNRGSRRGMGRGRGGSRQRAGPGTIRTALPWPPPRDLSQEKQDRRAHPLVAAVEPNKCIGCGTCEQICPEGAISVEDVARIDPNRCSGCGLCVGECPQDALSLGPAGSIREKAAASIS